MPPKRQSARAAAAAAATSPEPVAPPKTKKSTTAAAKKGSTTAAASTKPASKATTTKQKQTAAAARKQQKTDAESDKENSPSPKADDKKRKRTGAAAKKDETSDDENVEDEVSDVEPAPKKSRVTKDYGFATATANKTAKPMKPVKGPKADKVAKPIKQAKAPLKKRVPKALKVINEAPNVVMDIFVFGEGSSGELGLGSVKVDGKKPIDVKRPRINPNLQNVVQIACGGMHVAALTSDNTILTWGVNDQGALGRDTQWEGGLRDVEDEASDDEDDDDTGLNPKESTPAEIDTSLVAPDTVWVQVVASDSATFALTSTGHVYGWGTFRSNEGILGFDKNQMVQKLPVLVPTLSKIKMLAAGSNHILALDEKNKIFAWGAGQQAQLARRLLERDDASALYPSGIGSLPGRAKANFITCGSYHCFVKADKGVIGWGLNNYAELGVSTEAGQDGGYILKPQFISSLEDYDVADIAGGEHHSLACTADGQLLTWGRIDGHQVGQPEEAYKEDNTVWDENNKPRILLYPQPVPGIHNIVQVAAGTDHSFAVTSEGKVFSWGFSANYQTGQGTDEDIDRPTLIDNTAIRDRKIIFAGAGGQYSILGAARDEEESA
ncbi:putative regulator of chromosome condensation protein [Podospora didyma]|uniref:Regulator of chromosome condensation protein n=1 Tax=Podospora didyma TaxID=330526 RepID=A0AAE0NHP1_9PEZI|nr:putative regulator of chromosome condensation protein [Podospora didyma]